MQVIFGLIGLGLLILIHETGHFLAARSVGIEVEVFSLGWGRKLFGFKRGATEFRLSIFPLGGYAKMKGDTAYRNAYANGLDSIEVEEHSFFSASPLKRIWVVIAGPLMNLLFAIIVFSLFNLLGSDYLSYSNTIVLADDYRNSYPTINLPSPAAKAGLQSGDKIIAINKTNIENYRHLQQEIAQRATETVGIEVIRGDTQLHFDAQIELNKESGLGLLGVLPYIEPIVAGSNIESTNIDNNNAELVTAEGLQRGDRIIAVNDHPINHVYDIQNLLSEITVLPEQVRVSLTVQRADELLPIPHNLFFDSESETFSLGLSWFVETYREEAIGFFSALASGLQESMQIIGSTVKGIALLFQGLNPSSAISGPIRITALVGQITAEGFQVSLLNGIRSFFYLLSILSVALFFGNLLPIPVLDGGQILIAIAELIKGTTISPKTFFRYQTIGGVIVFGILIFVLISDFLFLVGGLG